MKKYLILVMMIFSLLLVGCNKKFGLEFKKEYESLNGEVSKSGKEHRKVNISEDNPYEKVTPSEIVKKIENKETFYVYFGDKLCPWCRSVIEKSIEVAKDNKVKKIYYVPIWNDEGEEILRDKYEFIDGEVKKTIDGASEYKKLLEYFDNLLSEYNIKDAEGNNVSTGEKRIYAPNFIYIEEGVAKKITTGTSDKQTNSREELTKEILADEEKLFNDFFKKSK